MVAPHLLPQHSVADAKRAMRKAAAVARAGCDPAWGEQMARHVLAACPPVPGAVVAGFWPIGREIDPRPLLLALHGRDHVLVLPVTPPRGAPLAFREWRPGDALTPEPFGTMRPHGPERRPDWLLVPLLAFDRAGRRLGYGGGYYDRTLAGLPGAVAIGCAYAAQEVLEVPADAHDIRLAAIATEREVVRAGAHR